MIISDDAITLYREPTFQNISNLIHPKDHSCDNSLLFSSTFVYLNQLSVLPEWYTTFVDACAIEPGLYRRYPGWVSENRHDDLTGVAAASPLHARRIYEYGKKHYGFWNVEKPGAFQMDCFLRRIPGFFAAVKASAGLPLSETDILELRLSYYWNTFEDIRITNGKCLLYLRLRAVQGKSAALDRTIENWKAHMKSLYPGGMREVYWKYFGPTHPFTVYGPTNFDA